jgi:hypothetical protein
MFTICSFNSPDLDGHRAPKMKYCPTAITVPVYRYFAVFANTHFVTCVTGSLVGTESVVRK